MEKNKIKIWKKLLIMLAVVIIIAIVAIIAYKIYWHVDMNIRFKEYEKIQAIETKGTLKYEKDYAKVENMDYITQDGIGVKVDSISITDDAFIANINFKFDKEIYYETLGLGYTIYDENKNIYTISSRMHLGENKRYDYNTIFEQRELGVYNKNNIYNVYLSNENGYGPNSINKIEKTMTIKINVKSEDKFPESKKIYIKLYDLGYYNMNKDETGKPNFENINLSDAKWLFEFDIPEEMNNR